MERYRTAIIWAGVLAVAAVGLWFVLLGASSSTFACSTILPVPSPIPTVSLDPSGSQAPLGTVVPDHGRTHITVGDKVTYTYCPPTSGKHYNVARQGPIELRVYGPDDDVVPQGWIHNLEHGMIVVLYRGKDVTEATMAAFRTWHAGLPPSSICKNPRDALVARFDQMHAPFAVLAWDRILWLPEWDPAAATASYQQWSDRGPEPVCAQAVPTAEPTPVRTAAPSASPTGSPSASPTGSPSANPTGSPSANPTPVPTSPSASPTPEPTTQPSASPVPPAAPTPSPS